MSTRSKEIVLKEMEKYIIEKKKVSIFLYVVLFVWYVKKKRKLEEWDHNWSSEFWSGREIGCIALCNEQELSFFPFGKGGNVLRRRGKVQLQGVQ